MQTRSTFWQILLFFLFFASSLECLYAIPVSARKTPGRNVAARTKGRAPLKKASTSRPLRSTKQGLGAPPPRPEVFAAGQFAGIRVKVYEVGSRVDTIHPGVVVGGPNRNREYMVVMISSRLPGNPPQKPISDYQTGTGIEGNVSLVPIVVPWSKMKAWRQKGSGTGAVQPALSQTSLNQLLADIRATQTPGRR